MNNDAFDRLKMDFPIFEMRNIRGYAVSVMLADGDSVQVQPHGTAKINSVSMIQLPDFTAFKMISPTMADIIKSGVLSKASPSDQPVFTQSQPEPESVTLEVMPEPTPEPVSLPPEPNVNLAGAEPPRDIEPETEPKANFSSSQSTSSKSSKHR